MDADTGHRDELAKSIFLGALEVGPGEARLAYLDRRCALGGTDVDEAAIVRPGESAGERARERDAEPGHCPCEVAHGFGILVHRVEQILVLVDGNLRRTRAQRGAERSPGRIEVDSCPIEQPADVRAPIAIEVKARFGRVGVTIAVALEQAQRNQRVEEVARSPGVWSGPRMIDLDEDTAERWLAGLAAQIAARPPVGAVVPRLSAGGESASAT